MVDLVEVTLILGELIGYGSEWVGTSTLRTWSVPVFSWFIFELLFPESVVSFPYDGHRVRFLLRVVIIYAQRGWPGKRTASTSIYRLSVRVSKRVLCRCRPWDWCL